MLAGLSIGTEFKRFFKGVMPRVAIATIILMPLLYGAMYLWVFWDPFSKVDRVPVALVNQDQGASVAGKDLKVGDQVEKELLGTDELSLTATSATEASEGLASGKYYFTVTIPKDFSSAVVSAQTKDPHKATVDFEFNDANSYIAGVVGKTAASKILEALNNAIGGQAVDQVLVGLTSAGDGLGKAADGADRLAAGLVSADSGAQQLASGADELATNLVTARDGSATLAGGIQQLASGINAATGPVKASLAQIAQSGIKPSQYAADMARLSGEAATVLDGIGQVGAGQSQAEQALTGVIGQLRASRDPNARALAGALEPVQSFLRTQGVDPDTTAKVNDLSKQSKALSGQLGDSNSSLRSMLSMVESGELTGTLGKLSDGVNQLADGSTRLHSGLVQLTDGSVKLADGATRLAEGTPQLVDGAKTLAGGLNDGVKRIPDFGGDEQRKKAASTLSQPVALNAFTNNPAPTFGSGFSPFFLPLAIFIGNILIWMILKPIQPRSVIAGRSGLRTVLASYVPGLLISLAQIVVMYSVARFVIGLNAAHSVGLAAFMALIAAAFLAFIQMLNAVFGPAVARVLSIALLMVQVVASGGIYPVETTAKPAQILHPFDPMSYAVTGMRQLIAGGVDVRLVHSAAVLAGLLLVSLAISAWAARNNRQYSMKQLYPPVQV